MDKLSIVIPVYNTEKYLDDCLKSILNQSYKNIELIIVNDGSTDKSENIIKKYLKKSDKIKYKKIINSGVSVARNIGINMSTGKYIAFVDSDDYIDKDMYLKMINKSIEDDSDIVTCAYNKIYPNDVVKTIYSKNEKVFGYSLKDSNDILLYSNPYTPCKIFKRNLIVDNNILFDEDLRIFEDLVFCYKLYIRANKISYINEPLYYYNCKNVSSLTNMFSEKMFDIFPALDRLKEYKNQYIPIGLEKQMEYVAVKHITRRYNSKYKDRKLMFSYIDKSFDYLNKNYKEYKKCHYYKGIRGFVKKNKLLLKLAIMKNYRRS